MPGSPCSSSTAARSVVSSGAPATSAVSSSNMSLMIVVRRSSAEADASCSEDSAPRAAPPQDADPVPDGERLVQLVRDEHDGRALILEAPQDLLEFLHALRGEHGRGLVEDQHPGSAPEGADDLDLLLAAQGRSPVRASGSTSMPSIAAISASRLRAPSRSSRSDRAPSIRFSSTVSAGISVECW